jgi:hypothetical protein
MGGTTRERDHIVEERRECVVERLASCRADSFRHLLRRRPPNRRLGRVRQPVDERVDRAVAERAHLLTVELERIGRFFDTS